MGSASFKLLADVFSLRLDGRCHAIGGVVREVAQPGERVALRGCQRRLRMLLEERIFRGAEALKHPLRIFTRA